MISQTQYKTLKINYDAYCFIHSFLQTCTVTPSIYTFHFVKLYNRYRLVKKWVSH
jgi:hypothetical protein